MSYTPPAPLHIASSLIVSAVNSSAVATLGVVTAIRSAYACALSLPLSQVVLNSTLDLTTDVITYFATRGGLNGGESAPCVLAPNAGAAVRQAHDATSLRAGATRGGVVVGLIVEVLPGPQPANGGSPDIALYLAATNLTSVLAGYAAAQNNCSSNPLFPGMGFVASLLSNATGWTAAYIQANCPITLAAPFLAALPPPSASFTRTASHTHTGSRLPSFSRTPPATSTGSGSAVSSRSSTRTPSGTPSSTRTAVSTRSSTRTSSTGTASATNVWTRTPTRVPGKVKPGPKCGHGGKCYGNG